MATLIYTPLTALEPVALKYRYYKDENLQIKKERYLEGYTFFDVPGLANYRDTTFNRGSCFILTSAVSLSSFFPNQDILNLGKIPGTIQIQSRHSINRYVGYNENTNTFVLSPTAVNFFIDPISTETQEVEIKVFEKYLQIDENYPFYARLSLKSLDGEDLKRQRFFCTYQNNILMLKTLTNQGYRYLAFGSDKIFRATGLILNTATLHDYGLSAVNVTTDSIEHGSNTTNNWITYYQDFESQNNNNTATINKNIDAPVNFLIDFSLKNSIKNKEANLNIANLKTYYTPAGGPAPVDNSYAEEIITTN